VVESNIGLGHLALDVFQSIILSNKSREEQQCAEALWWCLSFAHVSLADCYLDGTV
jgi:hypothetical protein